METNKMLKGVIIQELMARDTHSITRDLLMRRMWEHYQHAEELDEIMNTFNEAGMVIMKVSKGVVIYTMPDRMVNEYRKLYATRK